MTADLIAKGWPRQPGCKLCGELETAMHLVFCCPLSHFNWWCVRDAFGWEHPPRSFEDFIEVALSKTGSKSNRLCWAIAGALEWSIWTSRHDAVFNRKICSSALSNVFKTISFLTQWTALLPEKLKARWRSMVEKLRMVASKYKVVLARHGIG